MSKMSRRGRGLAVALLATGLASLQPGAAQAAAAPLTAPAIVYTGTAPEVYFTPGDETGPYTVDLMKGSTLVARATSGTQIDDVYTSGGRAYVRWPVPTTMKLEGTGYSLALKVGATTLASDTFEIAASRITGAYLTPSTATPYQSVNVTWSADGVSGNRVAINLVKSDGKTKLSITKLTYNDGSHNFVMPAKATPGSWQVEVVPDWKHALSLKGPAFTVAALATPTINMLGTQGWLDDGEPEPTTYALGTSVYAQIAGAPAGQTMKVALLDAAGKKVVDYGVVPTYTRVLLDGPKLGAAGPGTYTLEATFPAIKGLKATQALTLTRYTAPTITAPDLAAGVALGQQVTVGLEYRTTGETPTTDETKSAAVGVVATDGAKVYKLATGKKLIDGRMSFTWNVATTLPPGTAWKLQFLNENAANAVLAETAAFTVRTNPTTLAKNLTASSTPGSAPQAGALAVGATLYTGSTAALTFTAGAETGPYTVDLMSGSTVVARIASGTQIDDLGVADATATVKWIVPTTMKLEGTGYTAVVTAGATTITSSTFAIAASMTSSVTPEMSSVKRLEPTWLTWSSLGATGDQVAIDLVDSAGKTTTIVKQTDNDGLESVAIPAKAALGAGTLKVRPLLKAAAAGSAAVTITATSTPTIRLYPLIGAANPSTAPIGGIYGLYVSGVPTGDTADIAVVNPSTGKSLMSIAKGVTFYYQQISFLDKNLTAAGQGNYEIRVTPKKNKDLVTKYPIQLLASSVQLNADTLAALGRGVIHGGPLQLVMTTGAINLQLVIQVSDGKKTYVIAPDAILEAGNGSYGWFPSDKLAPGSNWKIEILDRLAKKGAAPLYTSPTFTISKNPTTLAADLD